MALFDKQNHVKISLQYFEVLRGLEDKEAGAIFKAVLKYCKDKTEPIFENDACKNAWSILKRFVDYQELHPRWRFGNIDGTQRDRNTPEYRLWREEVFNRDGYTCQMCGQKGGKLNAHHILKWSEYPKERFNVSNGMTLCESCHREIHRR